MRYAHAFRRSTLLALLGSAAVLWSGCLERSSESVAGPSQDAQFSVRGARDIAAAIAAQQRHTPALMRIPGVVGTAVGVLPNGQPVVRIFLLGPDRPGLPSALDGVPVAAQITGRFMVLSNPRTRERPAPVGYSVGHPAITAGSIGARVRDSAGNVYILSNNHVLANSNNASIGDAALQPGPFDGGTLADRIGTLSAFQILDFSGGNNRMDAAIALSSSSDLGNATPIDDGYGPPGGTIYGDANGDGVFDNIGALLGLGVQKYGRTTKLTRGSITGVNATLNVCYEVLIIFCIRQARFVDQLVIEPGSFSGGGDSGSLIVSDDANASPVGLLFAGSTAQTIANRIDIVLHRFGVTVDGDEDTPTPPTPLTDLAVAAVSAPANVTRGDVVNVTVSVRNAGNQDVTESFAVRLHDATDEVTIGAQSVAGLAAGMTTTLAFSWNTAAASLGSHVLTADHGLADDDPANDQASAVVMVSDAAPASTIHVGNLDAFPSNDGSTWSAVVEVTVHGASHAPLNGATVVGVWNPAGLASTQCTTGELGGNGTCIFLFPGIRKNVKSVTFTVTSVTMAGLTYAPTLNHDPDGDSNGTTIQVNRP